MSVALATLLIAPRALAENKARSARAAGTALPPPTAPLTTLPPRLSAPQSSLRVPALLALGIGGLGAGGAVISGVAAQAPRNEVASCGAQCGGGRASPDSALAITSVVLTVVAATGIGAGIVLLLTENERREKRSLSPSLRLKLSPQRGVASAVWKF